MAIRKAKVEDAVMIKNLLEQLDYPTAGTFVADKLAKMLSHTDHELLVYELNNKVVAFISIHFIPQIALAGDFAMISYFAVDATVRSKGIGKTMEAYAEVLARSRNCDRMQLHSSARRVAAHKFYERQGYQESPKYFSKKLYYN
ncbi:GNAT superfamily N-acetyltransferase [Pedobacter sp. AK017]|uniref:GNAT family N-acetyltransferase n=1 Tax=Pedobacter sp. AK017 TaxID=2723073 RepID=UPI001830D693|nr:GNAT family N-acetyltransferase [Pedobacter sp. AK017]MBB5439465.1 GNAT superfamily N-acetyltransferase [Pedobacter sp. AK017]